MDSWHCLEGPARYTANSEVYCIARKQAKESGLIWYGFAFWPFVLQLPSLLPSKMTKEEETLRFPWLIRLLCGQKKSFFLCALPHAGWCVSLTHFTTDRKCEVQRSTISYLCFVSEVSWLNLRDFSQRSRPFMKKVRDRLEADWEKMAPNRNNLQLFLILHNLRIKRF